jgi:hypothetical protein
MHLQLFKIDLWKDQRLPIEGKHNKENTGTGFVIETVVPGVGQKKRHTARESSNIRVHFNIILFLLRAIQSVSCLLGHPNSFI